MLASIRLIGRPYVVPQIQAGAEQFRQLCIWLSRLSGDTNETKIGTNSMKTIKVRALVLREYEAGESDKRLLLLCKERGRIMVYARGARKPKSKFMAAAQVFTYADFVLAQGQGFYSVTQAEVIESFYNLRTDYDVLMAAHLVAEVCERTLWEGQDSDELLLLALKSLGHLAANADNLPPKQVVCVFLLRFFAFYGVAPQADACVICNLPGDEITDGVCFCAEGLVCAEHSLQIQGGKVIRKLSESAVFALRFILQSNLAQSFRFNAYDSVLEELRKVTVLLWGSHFEWEGKVICTNWQ